MERNQYRGPAFHLEQLMNVQYVEDRGEKWLSFQALIWRKRQHTPMNVEISHGYATNRAMVSGSGMDAVIAARI